LHPGTSNITEEAAGSNKSSLFVSLFLCNQDEMKEPHISVVIPVFNSEAVLPQLHRRLKAVLDGTGRSYELIYCEDSSMDKSWEVLQELKEEDPSLITAIQLSKNYGQHNASMCGLTFAKGEVVITLDDDLQHPPEEIPKLLEAYEQGYPDVVYGEFLKKQHSTVRNMGSYSVKKASKYLRKSKGQGSSFRLISRNIVDKVLDHSQFFVFIDELIFWYTDRIAFVPVRHEKRQQSKSNYTRGKLFRLISNLVFFYTSFPLKLMVYGGFIISFLTFFIGILFFVKRIFFNTPLGYTSLIVTILFSTSIIIFSLGLIGEYLSRMYQLQNKRPPYHIHKVL
jgi:undecaprenyl-phosphate 4-deoxy-4-formamido-L-arabinose transferase